MFTQKAKQKQSYNLVHFRKATVVNHHEIDTIIIHGYFSPRLLTNYKTHLHKLQDHQIRKFLPILLYEVDEQIISLFALVVFLLTCSMEKMFTCSYQGTT